jgi:hypothetical protein
MHLTGVRARMQGTVRVAEHASVLILPGGITEDTDLDLSPWVAAGFVMPMPERVAPVPKPEPKVEPEAPKAADPVAETTKAEDPLEPVVEPEPPVVASAAPEAVRAGRARRRV